MIPAPWLQQLFRQMEWADACIWRAAVALPQAAGDEGLAAKLYHLHIVQRSFLKIWRGDPMTFPEQSDFANLSELLRWARPYYAEAAEYLAAVDDAALQNPVLLPWAEMIARRWNRDSICPPALAETIFQVTSHSTYHRGQIAARLRELGGEPPLTDFIAWVWFGKPAPEWPSSGS